MKKYSVHIIWAVIVVVALVGGIFYGKSSAPSSTASRGSYASSTRSGFSRAGGGFVAGQIISVDSSSMMVSLANGSSQVVFYSNSTQVMKPTIVPASTLTTGTRVMIGGTANSDGSLTAQSIQVQTGNGFAGSAGNASGTRSGAAGGQ